MSLVWRFFKFVASAIFFNKRDTGEILLPLFSSGQTASNGTHFDLALSRYITLQPKIGAAIFVATMEIAIWPIKLE